VVMDRAIPFIQNAVKEKEPFFSVIWFHAPHLPVVAGPEHTALYPDVTDGHTKHYYGCISALDEQVGRLRAELRKLGIEKNTLVCFCSDNGPEGSDKDPGKTGGFRGRKRSLYEGGVRVPGVIEWPAVVKPATKSDFPAVTSDYLPTILDALGVEYGGKRPLDGISLLPMLRGEMTVRSRPIGFQSGGVETLNDQRFKLVRSKKAIELYDLIEDPYETVDLAKKEKAIAGDMAERLDHWIASCKKSDDEADYAMSNEKPLFQFGVIADCQYADAPAPKQMPQRFYRLAKDKLAEAVDHLNAENLDFTIHLGDFIDKDFVSFDVVGPIYNRLKAPHYHLLGNHDYSVSDEEKSKVVDKLGMPARYYDYRVKGWRFIVLDGNEISTLAYPEGSAEWKAGEAFRTKGENPLASWSGGIGAEQIAWLEARLEESKSANEPVILFCHYPVFPKGPHNLWNDEALVEIVSRYKDTVVSWMNGHNHDGSFGEKEGVYYLNFKGMLDTRVNAYATVSVFADRTLKVTGFGREPDRLLQQGRK
jgi:manganese-dependent ADP-ribose/CDP-alcohol diphosphatase